MIAATLCRVGLVLCLVAGPLRAEEGRSAEVERLMTAMGFDETIEILREEGRRHGRDLAREMLPEADPVQWDARVAAIHDGEKMRMLLASAFAEALGEADLAPMLAYYEGAAGRRVVARELGARRALLEGGAEAAAIGRYHTARDEDRALARQVAAIITDGNLVDLNVTGALNAHLMFLRGMAEGGGHDLTAEQVLAEVAAREARTRDHAADWLRGYLTLAFAPLPEAEVTAYAAFSRSAAGRDLNHAVFAAFNRLHEELSYLLGLAMAERLTSSTL